MFMRRKAFDTLGGFDERYFMFYEDVDLGWRLNLWGWRFAYEPSSLAYHKHHASMSAFGSHAETYLLERNALFTLYKNLEDDALLQALPATMALAVRRAMMKSGLDSTSYDLRDGGGGAEDEQLVSKQVVATLFALDQFTDHLPGLAAARAEIQRTRTVSDAMVWRLFGEVDAPIYHTKDFISGYEKLVATFDVNEPTRPTRVLVVTGDPIGRKVAGPAIRAWNMALHLASSHDVTLVSLSGVETMEAPFSLAHVPPGDDRAFSKFERWADVIIFQGHAMAVFASLRESNKILVADIYDPMHLEQLEQGRNLPAAQWRDQVASATEVLNEQLARGDFFLCASERQRMFWLGQLAALGRISPETYLGDPDLERLIAVVPFGLPADPPRHERDVLKGVLPGITSGDKLVLWSGGLYNWFDPKTLVHAVAQLSERRPNVRLFFQGTKHPHPDVPEMSIVAETRELARELGLLDVSVFFNDSWVDYSDRQNYLLEADAGVSTHFSHVETTFSFRTRILDYLWAGLPMVVTDGDHFAELIGAERLGVVVDAEDATELALGLERVLFDEEFAAAARANIESVRERYFWATALRPLVSFVAQPHPAADRATALATTTSGLGGAVKLRRRSGIRHDISRAAFYLKSAGLGTVLRKIARRLRRS
jgi:glycosyltransferase involved in cell wall biosynthesis